MKLREEEFYEQYHQHGGTTIIPTEIFNELYDDATEEIKRLKLIIAAAIRIYENCEEMQDYSTCDLDMYKCLKKVYKNSKEVI